MLQLIALIFFSIGGVARAAATFTPLGVPDATDVSGDGSVVVGYRFNRDRKEPYRWTRNGGVLPLEEFPPNVEPLPGYYSYAQAISNDGSTVVGIQAVPAQYFSWRWTAENGFEYIGHEVHSQSNLVDAVSGDGSVLVGRGLQGFFPAWCWTADHGFVNLSSFGASDLSADGTVFVSGNVRWTETAEPDYLGDLPGGLSNTFSTAISADGSTVTGGSQSSDSLSRSEAFRWTAATGIVGLGDLPGGVFASAGQDVSGDGSTVVGWGATDGNIPAAFLWMEETGMVNLRDYLIAQGVDNLASWRLTEATAISADGQTIIGFGTNPQGATEAWVATIPEPSMIVLAAIGVVGAIVSFARMRRATQHG